MSPTPITFFLAGEPDLEALRRLDPEQDWREFARGERSWVAQTYLRLMRRGLSVALSDQVPERGLVLFHAKQRRQVARQARHHPEAKLVSIRADNSEASLADFEVVQNGRWADGKRRFFVPFWPQAGLVPRDPARGTRVERLAFKGFAANLHPDFHSARWHEFVAGHGFEWCEDSVAYAGTQTEEHRLAWNDYREVDLIVALRPADRRLHTAKPATKLYNAWAAGVPAILGPEHAYRELRHHDLDYLEAGTLAEAEAAVSKLARSPELYLAMVDHGRSRAQEFSFETITDHWVRLLTETLPAQLTHHRARRLPLSPLSAFRRLSRVLAGRPSR